MASYVSWRNFITVLTVIVSLIFGIGSYALSQTKSVLELKNSYVCKQVDQIAQDVKEIKAYIFKYSP